MPKATFLKSAWYIQSKLYVRQPLVSDHLPYTTIYPKHPSFPIQNLVT